MYEELINLSKNLLLNLSSAEKCRKYLEPRLSKETIDKFDFGYFPNINELSIFIENIEFSKLESLIYPKVIEDASGIKKIYLSYFDNYNLLIPFKNAYGLPIALVARTLLSEEERKCKNISKYKNTKFDKGNHLFGLFETKKNILDQDHVYVVEGQFDLLKGIEKGITNIVALGNSMMTNNQFSLLLRYTKNITLILDNDEAGKNGMEKIRNKFGKYANIDYILLPDPYKDIDEFLSNYSKEELIYLNR
jgi:DNA primase